LDIECAANSTPLHAASYFGHEKILEIFVRSGFDLQKTNNGGNKPIEEAKND
jgi:hypothetical protein